MPTLFTSGKFTGPPLGTLETYAAGTLTPLATYTDQGGATENATTISLDANGQADVWLGELAYRFRCFDADGALQWDTDNISGSGSSTYYAQWRTDKFSGDGADTTFVLSADPGSIHNLDLSVDGLTLVPSVDYTLSGTTVTFTVAPPVGTDNIMVRYGEALPQTSPMDLITYPGNQGDTATGYVSSIKFQILDNASAADEMATSYVRRNATHTGGTSGFTSAAFRADSYVSAGATDYQWALVGVVDNSATAGQNVGGYLQGIRRSTGPTWGGVIEIIDHSGGDPTTGAVALEIDVNGNGSDANTNRLGIDIVVRKRDTGGSGCQAAFGVRLQNAGDATSSFAVGFDTSVCTILQASFKMAQGQVIAFNAAATKQLSYDGTGLKFSPDGGTTLAVRLNDAGTIQIGSTQVVGARDTGWTAMTGSTNKATAYDTSTVTLPQLAGRVMALQAALTAHGLIGA